MKKCCLSFLSDLGTCLLKCEDEGNHLEVMLHKLGSFQGGSYLQFLNENPRFGMQGCSSLA